MESIFTSKINYKAFSTYWLKYRTGILFTSPFLILLVVFTVLPIFVSMGLSLTYFNMLQPPKWIGLTNFKVLFMDDDVFLIALKNTILFSVMTGPLGFIMSFMFAWTINGLKFKNLFALAFYTPSIVSGVAISVVWLTFFSNDRYGFINNFLINLGVIIDPVMWTSNPKTIMIVIVFVSVWMSMGNGFLVFLAGLQNIPEEIYEAGKIDGVHSNYQKLVYLTIPMVKPQLLFGAVNAIVGSFGVFDIAVSIAGMPSPEYAGHTIVAHVFDYAFIRFEMGYASAIAMVLFFITFLLGRIAMGIFSSKAM